MAEQQQLESTFRALLDPIRDLAASWDIDIGDTLDDYLQELDGLNLVGVDGQLMVSNGVNFGKAALLIQGSTAVYGKKVEFLHQLVHQALDLISTKKAANNAKDGNGKKGGGSGSGKAAAASNASFDEERLIFGSDPSFLLLDDVVEEGANIDLEDEDDAAAANALGGGGNKTKDRRRSSRGRHSISGDFSRASTVLMHSVLQEDHGGSCLRMSSCVMDTSGALMIGGMLPERDARVPAPLAALAMQAPVGAVSTNLMAALGADVGAARLAGAVDDDHGADDGAMDFGGGGWDDDDGGDNDNDYGGPLDGGDDADSDPLQVGRRASVSRLGMDDDANDARAAAGSGATAEGAAGANHGSAARANLFGNSTKAAKQVTNKNAMSLLDPYDVTKGSKPAKKGRPYKIPPADGPFSQTSIATALASGDAARVQECLHRIAMFGTAAAPHEAYDQYLYGGKAVPQAGLANRLFAPVLKLRRDAAAAGSSSKGTGAAAAAREREASHGRGADFFLYKDPATSSDEALGIGAGADAVDDVYDDDDNDDGGFWGDDHDYDVPPSQDAGSGSDPGADVGLDVDDARPAHLRGRDMPRGAEPFDIFQDVDDDMVRRVEEALNEGLSSSQGATYEAICRQHIDNFMRGAEAYARETQLSQRVAEWTGRLEPMLRAQESAPEFDIHTYSDLVLAEVGTVLGHDAARRLSELGVSVEDVGALDDAENRDANAGSTAAPADNGGKREGAAAALGALCHALASDASAVDFAEIVHATARHVAWADAGDGTDGPQRRLKSSAEVCRVFLACLMLANTGNLEVVDRGGLMNDRAAHDAVGAAKGLGNFAVRLLEKERGNIVESYRAPSAEDAAAVVVAAAPVSKKSGRVRMR